jgi:hypothetical protein
MLYNKKIVPQYSLCESSAPIPCTALENIEHKHVIPEEEVIPL